MMRRHQASLRQTVLPCFAGTHGGGAGRPEAPRPALSAARSSAMPAAPRRALAALALLCVVTLVAAQSRPAPAPLVANLTVTLALTPNNDSPWTPRTIGTNLGACGLGASGVVAPHVPSTAWVLALGRTRRRGRQLRLPCGRDAPGGRIGSLRAARRDNSPCRLTAGLAALPLSGHKSESDVSWLVYLKRMGVNGAHPGGSPRARAEATEALLA